MRRFRDSYMKCELQWRHSLVLYSNVANISSYSASEFAAINRDYHYYFPRYYSAWARFAVMYIAHFCTKKNVPLHARDFCVRDTKVILRAAILNITRGNSYFSRSTTFPRLKNTPAESQVSRRKCTRAEKVFFGFIFYRLLFDGATSLKQLFLVRHEFTWKGYFRQTTSPIFQRGISVRTLRLSKLWRFTVAFHLRQPFKSFKSRTILL